MKICEQILMKIIQEDLKKILNTQTRVFVYFPIFTTYGQKSLSCVPNVFKFDILTQFCVKELIGEVYFDLS